jgi:hypothetical protein
MGFLKEVNLIYAQEEHEDWLAYLNSLLQYILPKLKKYSTQINYTNVELQSQFYKLLGNFSNLNFFNVHHFLNIFKGLQGDAKNYPNS